MYLPYLHLPAYSPHFTPIKYIPCTKYPLANPRTTQLCKRKLFKEKKKNVKSEF